MFYFSVSQASPQPRWNDGCGWYWGHQLQTGGCLKCRRKSISTPAELIAPLGRSDSRHTEALFHTDDSDEPFYYQHFWTEWEAPRSDDCCCDVCCYSSDIDSLTTNPSCFCRPCLFNCKKPKVRSVNFREFCCFRNEKVTFYKVMVTQFLLAGQIWMTLTLVSCCSPQQAEGVMWSHSHPKAFAQLRKRIFFLLFSNFLSQKSSTWNTCRSSATKSSLPALLKHSFWSSYPGESWATLAV